MVSRSKLEKMLEAANESIKQLKRSNHELAYKNRLLREELEFATAMILHKPMGSDKDARNQQKEDGHDA